MATDETRAGNNMTPAQELRRQAAAKEGMHRAKRGRIDAISDYFATHPGCTNRECAEALKFSEVYVSQMLAIVRARWTDKKRRSNSK